MFCAMSRVALAGGTSEQQQKGTCNVLPETKTTQLHCMLMYKILTCKNAEDKPQKNPRTILLFYKPTIRRSCTHNWIYIQIYLNNLFSKSLRKNMHCVCIILSMITSFGNNLDSGSRPSETDKTVIKIEDRHISVIRSNEN